MLPVRPHSGWRSSAAPLALLRHTAAHHRADRNKAEPVPAQLRQPRPESRERRVVRMPDGDRAAMLSRHSLDLGELLGDSKGCLLVVEEHVAGDVRNAVAIAWRIPVLAGEVRESRKTKPRVRNSSMTGAMLRASDVNLLPM